MADPHPLDRPVWNALASRQASFGVGDDRAMRFQPEYGLFAAAARKSPACMTALAELVAERGVVATVEAETWPPIPRTAVVSRAVILQMAAGMLEPPDAPGAPDYEIVPLSDTDAAEMLALATLTQPGPFFARTHQLGDFVGVKRDG